MPNKLFPFFLFDRKWNCVMESIVAARLGLWIADRLTLLQQSSSLHCNAKTQARGALIKHKVYVASTTVEGSFR